GKRTDDELPDLAYNRIYRDDNHWGMLLELPDGDVLWGGMSDNSTPIYRVTGWENWERQTGKVRIEQLMPAALRRGTGLHAEYFSNPELRGPPAFRRQDPEVWFGAMTGDHRTVPSPQPWFTPAESTNLAGNTFSGRWTGFLEPPFS